MSIHQTNIMLLEDERLIKTGKRKKIYAGSNNDNIYLSFLDNVKHIPDCGMLWNLINDKLFTLMNTCRIPNHYIKKESTCSYQVHNIQQLPFYIRVTNIITRDIHKICNIENATILDKPIIELIIRTANDFNVINPTYLHLFDWYSDNLIQTITSLSLRINDILRSHFFAMNVDIAECILQFGLLNTEYTHNQILLSNDLSPCSYNFWDKSKHQILTLDLDLVSKLLAHLNINYTLNSMFNPNYNCYYY